MNIIYTWFKNRYKKWYSEEFEILTLITSIKKSSEYYNNIILYTDEQSKKYIESYNLPIQIKIVEENDSKLWVLNKISTYEKQTKPFIHIDADCILLKKLPEEFKEAQIGFQSKEDFKYYKDRLGDIKVNTEDVFNFGIYVCNDLSINEKYCAGARNLAEKIKNIKPLLAYNTVVEQNYMASLLKDLNIVPSLLYENIEDINEEELLHLMHNKNSKEYFNKIKQIYERI